MNRKKYNLYRMMVTTILFLVVMMGIVFPARAEELYSITFSDPNCTVGGTVEVTMKITPAISSADIYLKYDGAFLEYVGAEGGAGNAQYINTDGVLRINDVYSTVGGTIFSYVLRFNTKQVGSTVISISDADITDTSAVGYDMKPEHWGTSTVTINPLPTYSTEARLSSLTLGGGTLSPAFDKDTYAYRMTVPYSTSSLALSYTTLDSKAKAAYWPYLNDLKVGETEFTVRVTAEDGKTEKDYVVIITRQENPNPPTEAPTQPKPTETQPKPTETQPAETTPAETPTEEPESIAFISDSMTLTVLPVPKSIEIPEGYCRVTRTNAEGEEYEALAPEHDEEPNHLILYGVKDDGKVGLYLYDIEENTLQRYRFEVLPTVPEETTAEPVTEEPSTEESSSEESTEAETEVLPTAPTLPSIPEPKGMEKLMQKLKEVPHWIWAAGGIFLFIILLVILLLTAARRSRKKKNTDPLSPEEEKDLLSITPGMLSFISLPEASGKPAGTESSASSGETAGGEAAPQAEMAEPEAEAKQPGNEA